MIAFRQRMAESKACGTISFADAWEFARSSLSHADRWRWFAALDETAQACETRGPAGQLPASLVRLIHWVELE